MIIYTALIGNTLRDELADVQPSGGVRYVCFTDHPRPASGWEYRPPQWVSSPCSRRIARWHKMNSHLLFPSEDVVVWHDAHIRLGVEPAELAPEGADIAVTRHRERDCIYEELEACLRLKKDDALVMQRQVNRYRKKGYPENIGLAETGVLARRHTPKVVQFNEAWWAQMAAGSVRDQLSFNFTAWSLQMPIEYYADRIGTSSFRESVHKPSKKNRPRTVVGRKPISPVRARIADYLKRQSGKLASPVLEIGSRIPDAGSWWADNRHLLPGAVWHGVDVCPGRNVDFVMDAESLTLEPERYGSVLCSEMLEHAPHPWQVLAECFRVLKPGGWCLVTTVFAFPVHGYPDDHWRFTPGCLERLLREAGFVDVAVEAAGEAYVVEKSEYRNKVPPRHELPMQVFAVARKPAAPTPARAASSARLTILCATSGRSTLADTLASIEGLAPGDEVLLVHDGPENADVRTLWDASRLPGRLINLPEGPHRDWGHTPRNRTLPMAAGDYVVNIDDDDVFAPLALDSVRRAIAEHPGDFFVFRWIYPDGRTLWTEPVFRRGNLGTVPFVHPAGIPVGTYAHVHAGDFQFAEQTVAMNPDRAVHFRTETLALLNWADRWVNPAFVDLATRNGAQGRGDSQAGWQERVGGSFSDRSILDVGAGLGASRARLAQNGNTVALHDPAPGMPVDLSAPLGELPDRSFDVVTAFDVIEHVPDDRAFVADLCRIAREAVVLSTPNFNVSLCGNPFHVREYTPPQLAALLRHRGRCRWLAGSPDGRAANALELGAFLETNEPHLAVQIDLA